MTISEIIKELAGDLSLSYYHGVRARSFAAINNATTIQLPTLILDQPKESRPVVEADNSVSNRWVLTALFLDQDRPESKPDANDITENVTDYENTESIIQRMRIKATAFIHALVNEEDATGRKVFIDVTISSMVDVNKITNRILSGAELNFEVLPMTKSMQC